MKELLQILLNRLNEIPGFVTVSMYNNQLKKLNKTDDVFPALFLELYGPIIYSGHLGDISYGTATVRVHITNESPEQGNEFDIYELKDLVHRYLHHYTTGAFEPLSRTGEALDTNHTNLYNYTIDYTTSFQELTLPIEPDDDTLINEVDITYDMYQDGDELLTDKLV